MAMSALWSEYSDGVYASITEKVSFALWHGCFKVFLEQDPLPYVRFFFDASALLLCSWEIVSLIFQRDKVFVCVL